MGLNETTKHMRDMLSAISVDLEKAAAGNKAAAQRVRTGTIKLEKTAKNYRRESINAEKSGNFPKRASQKKSNQKTAAKAKSTKQQPKAKARPAPAPKAKAKTTFNPKMMKRPANKSFKKA
ncbi:MAG: putative histone-like protein [Chlamydiia bacterium]|nr:putative histone-like protein [Chlamydiia bacterium]